MSKSTSLFVRRDCERAWLASDQIVFQILFATWLMATAECHCQQILHMIAEMQNFALLSRNNGPCAVRLSHCCSQIICFKLGPSSVSHRASANSMSLALPKFAYWTTSLFLGAELKTTSDPNLIFQWWDVLATWQKNHTVSGSSRSYGDTRQCFTGGCGQWLVIWWSLSPSKLLGMHAIIIWCDFCWDVRIVDCNEMRQPPCACWPQKPFGDVSWQNGRNGLLCCSFPGVPDHRTHQTLSSQWLPAHAA